MGPGLAPIKIDRGTLDVTSDGPVHPHRVAPGRLTMLAQTRTDPSQPPERRRHHTWNTRELKALSWTSLLLRDAAAWALTAMVVTGTLVVLVDVPLLLLRQARPSTALATGLFGAGLTAGLAAPLALLLTALATVVRSIWLRFGRRWAAFIPVVLVSLPVGWALAMPTVTKLSAGRLALVGAFVTAMVAIVGAGRSRRALVRLGGAVLLGGSALAVDVLAPPSFYREVHDLTCLITIMAGLVAARPLQRRAVDVPAVRLVAALLSGLALAAALMTAVDQLAPGWRRESVTHSRYATRLLALTRAVVDLDADGFSPIGWGGDCDDLDERRFPTAQDAPGAGDRNCNGIDPPNISSDRQRGLAPPRGNPDAAAGSIDLVLLITVSCLRADAFSLAMPRLAEHATRGITFDRMYAAGTRTAIALPLIATGSAEGMPLAQRLRPAGVTSTLVLGVNYQALIDAVGPGMNEVIVDREQTWTNAVEVTGRAKAHLRKATSQAGRRHFVWIHYFDAHAPSAGALPPTTGAGARAARDYYLEGLRLIDREVGELLDALHRRRVLERSLVIVTADHGEAFGEHGVFFHNVSGYEALTRVPAVMLAPGLQPGSHAGLVSHRDIFPTVLGAFGLAAAEPSAERFGRSWLRLRQAPAEPLHRFVAVRTHRFTSGPVAFSPMLALVQDRYKLVKAMDEEDLFELYDLQADPGEQRDLSWTKPELRESMERDLDLFRDLDRWP
jgi:hypothetical protein